MNKIFVPIDFSPVSKNAFQYAVRMGAEYGAKIILFHAYSPSIIEPYMAVYMQNALLEEQEELALKYFSELESEIPKAVLDQISVEYQISLGPAAEEILITTERLEPDLIVMGMRGGNLLAKKILGSTASAIIQRAKFPVLVVPEHCDFKGIRNIAYATNYEEEDTKVIDSLLDFAKKYDALLYCWHIREKGHEEDDSKQKILKKAYEHDLTLHNIDFETLDHPDVIKGLNQYAEKYEIDLLVMLTHHRSIFGQFFHKSHTREMTLNTIVPLMVFQKEYVPESIS